MNPIRAERSTSDEIIVCDDLPMRDQRAITFYVLYLIDAYLYEITAEAAMEMFARDFSCSISQGGAIFVRAKHITEQRDRLDEQIRPLLQNWRLERLSVSTRLILRYALWELQNTELDLPIVINEALELAKSFAEADAYKFINGVLEEWIKRNKPDLLAATKEKTAQKS